MEAAATPYHIWVVEKPFAHTCACVDILPPQTQLREEIHLTWKLSFHLLGGNHSKEVKRQLINNKGDSSAAASTLGKIFHSALCEPQPCHFLHVILALSEILSSDWIWLNVYIHQLFYYLCSLWNCKSPIIPYNLRKSLWYKLPEKKTSFLLCYVTDAVCVAPPLRATGSELSYSPRVR